MPNERAHAPDGNIYYPNGYREDFSQASHQEQETFIHEMGHVWQHQKGVDVPRSAMKKNVGNYDYQDIFDGKPFESLTLEQQAEFLKDWKKLKDAPPGSTLNGRDFDDYNIK